MQKILYKIKAYGYDAFGRMTSFTDAGGHETTYTYDALGRKTGEYCPDGSQTRTEYNDAENEIAQTDENGNRMIYRYTPLGQISRVIEGNSGTALTAYQYDLMLRPVYELSLDAGGVKSATRYRYDHFDRVTSTVVTDRAGAVLSDESVMYQDVYDKSTARMVKIVKGDEAAQADAAAQNIVTTEYYDLLGRTVKTGCFAGGKENIDTYAFDKAGNCTSVLTERDRGLGLSYTTRSEYDFSGRVTRQYNALGESAGGEYDALGRTVAQTDFKGNRTTYRYDSFDRMIEKRSPFSAGAESVARYRYDIMGNVASIETSSGTPGGAQKSRVNRYEYDVRGRLVLAAAENEGGAEYTKYEYDKAGNQTDVYAGGRAAAGGVEYAAHTRADYDRYGNVTARTDAMGQAETYRYDLYGVLQGKTDRNGNATAFVYDGLGRAVRTTVTPKDPETGNAGAPEAISVEYTRTGQIKSTKGDGIELRYKYDSRGLVVGESEASPLHGGVYKMYSYDAAGSRTGMTVADGGVIRAAASKSYS